MAQAAKKIANLPAHSSAVKPSSYLDPKAFLKDLFAAAKAAHPQYTYAQFAADLGFSPTNIIHHIIQGRRPLTAKTARVIAKSLGLAGLEARYFKALVDYAYAKTSTERSEHLRTLHAFKEMLTPTVYDRDALEYYAEWYHPVIGEFARLDSFQSDPKWISAHLLPSVRPAQVAQSLQLLERLGLIAYDEARGRHVRTSRDLSTGPEARGLAVAQYHSAMIEHGRQAIATSRPEERDISSLTLCLSEDAFKKLKLLIHEFQRRALEEEAVSAEKSQVYQLNIQFFPFSKVNGKRSKS